DPCDLVCPKESGLFSHPQDCTKWVHCTHNQPFVKTCPFVLHFNPLLRVCDWPDTANCQASLDSDCAIPDPIIPTEEPNPKPEICDCDCCLRPHPDDCTAYYYCENGTDAEFLTCTEGLVFHPNVSQCVLPEAYPECQPEKPPTCDPTCECLYPAEGCTEYYKCNGDGVPVKHECYGGLYFNDEKHTCDFPENVSCGQRKASRLAPLPHD
ncbi:hypothetical protein OTU49_012437, partial [Cherax quadricarinatus]